MPAQQRPPQRPRNGQSGAPRRLGAEGQNTRNAKSAGASRRYERSQASNGKWIGRVAVGAVVLAIVALVTVKLISTSSSGSGGIASGRDPSVAPASLVSLVATVPTSTFNSVGVAGQPVPFAVTKDQPPLTSTGKAQFVYEGGEFCPYCALMRWSLVLALSRFGTFTNLKVTSSANDDGDIPTFTFVGTTYSSKYITFSPYETEDRNEAALQTAPTSIGKLYAKYDGTVSATGTGVPAVPFNASGGVGIPFLDIGNKYVSSGDPNGLYQIVSAGSLDNGGPGRAAIAEAIRDPSSAVGKTIDADQFVVEANYLSAAMCALDGGKPASVCATPGVRAAAKALAASKPVG